MSKKIEWDKPLSDFDREYALQRGMHEQVAENDERFEKAPGKGRTVAEVRAELQETRERVIALEAELERLANPNLARPLPADNPYPHVGGTAVVGPTDNTPIDGEAPAGAAALDDYEDEEEWPYADLQAEAKDRGLKASGSRQEIIQRLREDDRKS